MEHLKQIEDDLNAISTEVGRKYPEVVEATASAIKALKAIREAYIATVVRGASHGSGQQANKFQLSSDLTSPYIIICNYNDCSPKQLLMALNGLQLLLKHDLVPVTDYQNVLRVLLIQAPLSNKNESSLKILQLILQIATSFLQNRDHIVHVNENIIGNLLNISLLFADAKYAPSILSAAQGTAKQIVGLIVDLPNLLPPGNDYSDELSTKAVNSFRFVLKEMLLLMNDSGSLSTKLSNIPPTFAVECIFELIRGWTTVVVHIPELKAFMVDSCQRMLLPKVHSLQLDYVMIATRNGSVVANNSIFNFCRILRLLVLKVDVSQEFIESLVESTFLALQPCGVDQIPSIHRQKSNDEKPDDSSLLSKFFPIAAVTSQVIGKASSAFSSSSVPSVLRPLLSEDSSLVHLFSRNPGSADESTFRFVSSHCVACCMDLLFASLHSTLYSVDIDEVQWRTTFNIVTKLVVASTEFISLVLNDSKLQRSLSTKFNASGVLSSWKQQYESGLHLDPVEVLHSTLANASLGMRIQETLAHSILSLRVAINVLLKLMLQLSQFSKAKTERRKAARLLMLPSVQKNGISAYVNDLLIRQSVPELWKAVQSFLDMAKDGVLESFHQVTLLCSNRALTEEVGYAMMDLALSFCLLDDSRSLGIILTTICRHTISVWHGGELGLLSRKSEDHDSRRPEVNSFLLGLLMQLLLVGGDYCSDWDCVADCLSQSSCILHNPDSVDKGLSTTMESIVDVTKFLTEENLVKFLTSFVSLSTSEIESLHSHQESFDAFIAADIQALLKESISSDKFMNASMWGAPSSFALSVVVSTAKLNSLRISSVWQMVTSHIRLVASSKFIALRKLAVVALFDILATTIHASGESQNMDSILSLSENVDSIYERSDVSLLNFMHSTVTSSVSLSSRTIPFGSPSLSQRDLMGSLVSLIGLEATDVRKCVLEGMHYFLLHYGQLLTVDEVGGWENILGILAVVPTSLGNPKDIGSDSDASVVRPWSHECLLSSFATVKMACEEFLEVLCTDEKAITAAIKLLQAYAAQQADVNVSLTAVETMWKISGLSTNKAPGSHQVINVDLLFESLTSLMDDQRADVRHCALNTLFMAFSANAECSNSSLLSTFQVHLFPLLDTLHAKLHATNSETSAPKGRGYNQQDTLRKQWLETLTLVHRGLLKSIRSFIKFQDSRPLFDEMLPRIVSVVVRGAAIDCDDQEPLVSCLDFLFGVLGVTLECGAPQSTSVAEMVLNGIKVCSYNRCGGNRDVASRVSNYIVKLLSEEKAGPSLPRGVQKKCFEVILCLFHAITGSDASPLRRTTRSTMPVEDDAYLRRVILPLLSSLRSRADLAEFVEHVVSLVLWHDQPRLFAVNGIELTIRCISPTLKAELQGFSTGLPNGSYAVQHRTHLVQYGKACAMSLCNLPWHLDSSGAHFFGDFVLPQVLLPREFCVSVGLDVVNFPPVEDEMSLWTCHGSPFRDNGVCLANIIKSLKEEPSESSQELTVLLSSIVTCSLCPWRQPFHGEPILSVSEWKSLLSVSDVLESVREAPCFEKVHRAVIVSILHGLLVFETENPDRIHPFAEASLSHSLHGYVDFVSKMSSPTFSTYRASHLILRQLLNAVYKQAKEKHSFRFPFLAQNAMLYIAAVQKISQEQLSSPGESEAFFWAKAGLVCEESGPLTFDGLHELASSQQLTSAANSDTDAAATASVGYVGASLVQFYAQFLKLLAILDECPLKELIVTQLMSLNVPALMQRQKELEATVNTLKEQIDRLKRDVQNNAVLSTFPF